MITPSYVIVHDRLINNYEKMKQRMAPCYVSYSMKANPCLEVASELKETDAYFEVSSLKEMQILHDLRVHEDRIYCGLAVMSSDEIIRINQLGCNTFTYDTIEQLHRIKKCCGKRVKKILRIRINDLVKGSIGYGMDVRAIQQYDESILEADGLIFHISDHSNMENTIEAIRRLEKLLVFNPKIQFLNIGGSYLLNGYEDDYKKLRCFIEELIEQTKIQIICEPGAAIVDTAVDALSKCIMVTKQDGFLDVFLDGGIPSGMTRRPRKIINLTSSQEIPKYICRFFDTTSMKRLLFRTRVNFSIKDGDILLLKDYGAYSYCYSNIFHSRPIPEVYVIRKDEDIESLVSTVP